jgi:UDP-glucose-4-epimerase GalE
MATSPGGSILVTGGAGYIGSHYVLAERERGHHVVVLDNFVQGHREALGDVPCIEGDLADRALVDEAFCAHPITSVVHFAAYACAGESMQDPGKYYRNNVISTLVLLESMHAHGIRDLVFSSSCATYGDPEYTPLDEAHPQRPMSPYGETKHVCERMIASYAVSHGLRFVAPRYFNAAGADPRGRLGESHDPETHLIPLALQVATGRREALDVHGTDYDTPDGTCIRDYVHVADLANAHVLALEALRQGKAKAAFYNLGTERGHSVREVVAACERVTGKRILVRETARRPGDPRRLVATAARARAELGWAPAFEELEAIVETAWRWERSRAW